MSVRLRKWTNAEGKVVERWMVDVKVKAPGTGKVIRVRDFAPLDTRRGAEQHERQIRQQILDGTFGKEQHNEEPDGPAPTLGEFSARFLTVSGNDNKHSTLVTKRQILHAHLLPALGHLRLDQLRAAEIEDFKAEMKRKVSGRKIRNKKPLNPKTINNALHVLGKLLSVAVEQGVIEHAPSIKLLKVDKPPFDFLTFDEAERLVSAADAEWRPMLTLALKSGLRLGELFGLQWADVDFAAGRLTVRRSIWRGVTGTPKGGRSRVVDLPGSVLRMLKESRHLKGPFVFCDAAGNPRTEGVCRWPLRQTLIRAGITRERGTISWHDLRHTYASHLVMRGTPLKVVQELLGHASIEMTMRYAHLSPEAKRDAVQCLDLPAPAPEGHKWGTSS
jgi:integrase